MKNRYLIYFIIAGYLLGLILGGILRAIVL